ncbi:MAG: tetratricopeptide repeat protein [Phycisphaerales bacterium]
MHRSIIARSMAAALAACIIAPAFAQIAGDDPALRPYYTGNGLLQRGMNELAATEYRQFLQDNARHEKAPLARYGLAVALFRIKDHAGAEKELRPLVELDDFEFAPEARVMLGQCLLAAGRPGDAIEPLEEVANDHADHDLADDAAALRVEALSRAGRHKDAVRAADELAERWPASPLLARAELFAASSMMADGAFAAASERLAAVLKRSPESELAPRATLLLGQAMHRAGKPDQARPHYEAVLKGGDDALVPDALLGLGALHLEQGRPRDAGQTLDRLIETYPKSALLTDARLRRARAWFDTGDFDQASKLLLIVEKDTKGESDEAAYWLAKCELRTEKAEASAQRLAAAINRFPESRLQPEMHYDRAVALLRAGQAGEAHAALAEFRERFADHSLTPDAVHLSASIAHQEGDHAACLTDAEEFLTKFPAHAAAPAVEFLAAESTLLSGDDEGAAKAYTRFLAKREGDPRVERAAFRLGAVLHRLGRGDEARLHLERVARGKQTREEFRPALLLLGDLSFAAGDWADAERRLADYTSLDPSAAGADDALLKLGLSRARQDRPADALACFDDLLARFKDSPHRLQATFERGQALVALKRTDDAAASFERVLADGDDSRFAAYAHNHLGAIVSAKGDKQAAAEHFAMAAALGEGTDLEADALFEQARSLAAAGQHDGAAATYAVLLREFPSHRLAPESAARFAISTSRQDKHAEALAAIVDAEKKHAAALPAPLRDSLAYEKAWCLRKLGRGEEAAPICRELMARAEPTLKAYAAVDLAELEAEAGRHAPAAEILRTVLAGKPPPDVARRGTYQLGVCAFRTEKFEEAATMMQRFLEAPAPANNAADAALTASASLVAGESCLKLGRHKQAAEHLKRVVDGHPKDPTRPTALLRLGEAQAVLQLWAESEKTFGTYLTEFGSADLWFQAKFGAGWAMENQGRIDDAVKAYREVVDRHQGPTAARAQFQVGECLFAKKEYETAARELLKVDILYDYPEWSAAALYEAGRCFESMNDLDNARKQYELVRAQHGQTRWASLAGERLTATKTKPVPGR